MKRFQGMIVVAFVLAGCAGVEIEPISPEQATAAHTANSAINGYIVYEPLVAVEVSKQNVCVEKDSEGKCSEYVSRCSAGAPFVLPDYSKPYRVEIKSGFGKSGAEVSIADGWRLENVKDSSDNTAVLGTLEKILGIETAPVEECKSPGLYRVNLVNGGIELSKLLWY
ncbi:hypothetical protein [Salinisphaera sp. PC39]|uniref:hypothetical protein n=1 Tax=Salinisphaera sp. PC39 TaxID=1304156 RepID=UPI00334076A1